MLDDVAMAMIDGFADLPRNTLRTNTDSRSIEEAL